jgi:hypothetical protein
MEVRIPHPLNGVSKVDGGIHDRLARGVRAEIKGKNVDHDRGRPRRHGRQAKQGNNNA